MTMKTVIKIEGRVSGLPTDKYQFDEGFIENEAKEYYPIDSTINASNEEFIKQVMRRRMAFVRGFKEAIKLVNEQEAQIKNANKGLY